MSYSPEATPDPDDFPVILRSGQVRWTTQRQIDFELDNPPRHAPGYLLSRDEWPTFDCGFQCPASGYGLRVEWNADGDLVSHVEYDEDTYGEPEQETRDWARHFEGKQWSTAAYLVDALVEAGCELDDLL